MRRADGLFEHIVAFGNLLAAERLAARGKRDREAVARFELHLERELIQLQQELIEDRYRPAAFYTFEVRDPKPRAICAAPFRDRVVHHAVCDVLEPVLERSAIFDSYACRVGKGTHAAIARAQQLARRHAFFLKCDVRRAGELCWRRLSRRRQRTKAFGRASARKSVELLSPAKPDSLNASARRAYRSFP